MIRSNEPVLLIPATSVLAVYGVLLYSVNALLKKWASAKLFAHKKNAWGLNIFWPLIYYVFLTLQNEGLTPYY